MSTTEPKHLSHKVEIGGGTKPRGEGFVNVDILPTADVQCNFESDALPFSDESVEEVYASHVLEHVRHYGHLLKEIVRICRVGARVEIRSPHPAGEMAMCSGHVHTIGPAQVRHWCSDFPLDWFGDSKRRLRLLRIEYTPGEAFGEVKDLLGWWSDDQVMRLFPNCCHEIRFHFDVVGV